MEMGLFDDYEDAYAQWLQLTHARNLSRGAADTAQRFWSTSAWWTDHILREAGGGIRRSCSGLVYRGTCCEGTMQRKGARYEMLCVWGGSGQNFVLKQFFLCIRIWADELQIKSVRNGGSKELSA